MYVYMYVLHLLYVHVCIASDVYTCVYMYHMYECIVSGACMHVCMYVCMHVCMYVFTTQQACLQGYHAVLSVGEAPRLDFLLLCEGDGTCSMVCH